MNRRGVSKITCIADVRLTGRIEAEADRLGILSTFSERGKQVALKARPFWRPFGHAFTLIESPADIIRLYVPRACEQTVMASLASAADLFLPGRGSLFAEDVVLVEDRLRPWWDEARLRADLPAWDAESRLPPAADELVFCILPRGRGPDVARAMLEMGLGVPVISYGEGMGMRDRLGLLRITIPPEKEMLWFLVPAGDADLLASVAVRKAGLREPGQGFLARVPVRALVVNTRMNLDRRRHVATMEQVISTLDQLQGSTDWRRRSAAGRQSGAAGHGPHGDLARFTVVCEEGAASVPVRAALEAGAGGATLSRRSRRSPGGHDENNDAVAMVSHARECCDLIVPAALVPRLEQAVAAGGLFDKPADGFIEIGTADTAVSHASE